MSVQTLQTLSVISFAVAGVCFVLAVFFWFFFNIPTVIGDLSGRTARKSIAKMRAANEKNGAKPYKENKNQPVSSKVTGNIPKPQNVQPTNNNAGQPETGLLAENRSQELDLNATQMLNEETGMLDSEATSMLIDENATMPLATPVQQTVVRPAGKKIDMLEEVIMINTAEVI